jgi:molybdopterin-binding protein
MGCGREDEAAQEVQFSMIRNDMANSFVRMLSVRDAADRLGVSYPTLKQWIYKGSLRTVRTDGGHHRVPESEVHRLLAHRGDPPPRRGATGRPHGGTLVAISGRNQLRGTIEEVRADGVLAQVRLRIGDQLLTAIITRDAAEELKLRRGDAALAIIKSTEVMIATEEG